MAATACEWYFVCSFRNWVIRVTYPWPCTELLSKVGNVPVRIASGRSQARQVAEVGSGSEKYPHSTLCHSREQKYPVQKRTLAGHRMTQYACLGVSHGIRRRLSKKIPNTGTLTKIGYA